MRTRFHPKTICQLCKQTTLRQVKYWISSGMIPDHQISADGLSDKAVIIGWLFSQLRRDLGVSAQRLRAEGVGWYVEELLMLVDPRSDYWLLVHKESLKVLLVQGKVLGYLDEWVTFESKKLAEKLSGDWRKQDA